MYLFSGWRASAHWHPGRGALLVAGLLAATTSAALARSTPADRVQQETAMVKRLVANVNAHRLSAASNAFSASAILQVSGRQIRGRHSVAAWWKAEFARGVAITLTSSIRVRGVTATALSKRTTRNGDCAGICWERASWRFTGSHIDRMTLAALQAPGSVPRPPATIPPPPTAPPSPHVTPTIPT